MNVFSASPRVFSPSSPRMSRARSLKPFVRYHRTGYPERTPKGSLKSHKKTKLEGKSWAHHRPRPSPPGSPPRLRPRTGGLGALTQSPPHARPLTRGLGKEPNLRLARGPVRTASNKKAILHIARGRLVNNPSLPPRPVFPTACHVPLIRQPLPQSQPDDDSTPRSGRRDMRSHQRHTG